MQAMRQKPGQHEYRNQMILSLRADRKKQSEIAHALGCSLTVVKNVCRQYGITETQVPTSEDKAKEIIQAAGYDYIEGFINTHSKVTIRCRTCGNEYQRMFANIRKELEGKYPNKSECMFCKRHEQDKRQAEKEREAQAKAQRLKEEKAEQLSRKVNNELAKRLAIHVCKNCGAEFCISCTGYNSEVYCSDRCQKRWHERLKNDKRMKRLLSRKHDTDITLDKLFKRDGGVCYICGQRCDWNDSKEVDGTFVAGDNYPSIEHVKPVSKGGTHTWDNVKLACRHCNTLKGWK